MRGPLPKDPKLRQRRNRASTATKLVIHEIRARVPSLPKRSDGQDWHRMTKLWWKAVWRSPMATEYLDADVKGRLYRLAILVDRFWMKPSINLDAQICRNEAALGLTPMDRRRLQWEIERVDAATQKRQRSPSVPTDDPRQALGG